MIIKNIGQMHYTRAIVVSMLHAWNAAKHA